MVPLSASSNLPGFSLVAPVKAPRSWPNSSLSRSSLGSAAQLIFTNGLPRRTRRRRAGGLLGGADGSAAALDGLAQLFRLDGLDQVVARAEPHRLDHGFLVVHRGEGDHRSDAALGPVAAQDFESVDARHPQV